MARYYGKVGFVKTIESSPGVFTEEITERNYYGDVLTARVKWSASENLNDDLGISNQISILADEFAMENFSVIKYVEWSGVLWKVSSIEIKRPRLVMMIGGEYVGQQT